MGNKILVSDELIENKIYLIRGKKVMFDYHLAELYEVETKALKRSVKRNIDRFPRDFMFQLDSREATAFSRYQFGTLNSMTSSESQIVTLKRGQNIKYLPYVFTEQGVAMLSSVLNSKRAIQVNIQIMRTFTKIREMIISNKELRYKIEGLEKKYDKRFTIVFEAIRKILETTKREAEKPKKKIGFECKK
jgi:hypothetical protein